MQAALTLRAYSPLKFRETLPYTRTDLRIDTDSG